MTRQRIVRAAVVAAVAVALGWGLRSEPAVQGDQASGATREEIAALRKEIDGLRAGAQVTRAAIARVAPGPDRAGAAVAPGTEPAAHAEHDGPAAQRMPEPAQVAAQLDVKFAAQDSDPAWSRDAARQADQALASALPAGTTLGHVECHASLCRVESFHESREAYRSFVDASFLSRDKKLWNGAAASIVLEASEAGVKAVSYIAREGSEFPTVEPIDG
ncbi:MAG TPA: hypothetical protein VGD80_36800 [Kofleriaceae bacterium]